MNKPNLMNYMTLSFGGIDDWLAWRKEGIGASDVPMLLNISRFGDRLDLFADKVGLGKHKPPNHAVIAAANVSEQAARERLLIDGAVEHELSPMYAQSLDYSFMRCSLDGWSSVDHTLMEHKMLGEKMFDEVVEALSQNTEHSELKAILSQITYQCMIVKPKTTILALTSFQDKRFRYFKISKDKLPRVIKIKNRVIKFWTLVDWFKKKYANVTTV